MTKKQMIALQYRNRKLQDNSRLSYGYAVRSYLDYVSAHGLADVFNPDNVKEWLAQFHNPNTYNLKWQAIKEWYRRRYETRSRYQRLLLSDGIETIKRKQPARSILQGDGYLTHEQVMRLADVATQRVSCFILALYWSGCRISELINIRLSDCRESDVITINIVGKGYRGRYVYLPRSLYKMIRRVFAGKTYLFETREGRQYGRSLPSDEIRRQAKKKMGLHAHAHMLRHSKAMFLKERGVSADQIARALGHASVTTTLAYYLHGVPTPGEQGIETGDENAAGPSPSPAPAGNGGRRKYLGKNSQMSVRIQDYAK